MQAVLDAPMGADGRREGLGVERRRGEVVSPLPRDRAVSLDAGFDHADHRQMGEARLIGIAAIREQPVDLVADAWRRSSTRPWSPSVVLCSGSSISAGGSSKN